MVVGWRLLVTCCIADELCCLPCLQYIYSTILLVTVDDDVVVVAVVVVVGVGVAIVRMVGVDGVRPKNKSMLFSKQIMQN